MPILHPCVRILYFDFENHISIFNETSNGFSLITLWFINGSDGQFTSDQLLQGLLTCYEKQHSDDKEPHAIFLLTIFPRHNNNGNLERVLRLKGRVIVLVCLAFFLYPFLWAWTIIGSIWLASTRSCVSDVSEDIVIRSSMWILSTPEVPIFRYSLFLMIGAWRTEMGSGDLASNQLCWAGMGFICRRQKGEIP